MIFAAIIGDLRSKSLQGPETLQEQALVGTGLPCLPCMRVPFDRKTPIMVESGLNPTIIGAYGGGHDARSEATSTYLLPLMLLMIGAAAGVEPQPYGGSFFPSNDAPDERCSG